MDLNRGTHEALDPEGNAIILLLLRTVPYYCIFPRFYLYPRYRAMPENVGIGQPLGSYLTASRQEAPRMFRQVGVPFGALYRIAFYIQRSSPRTWHSLAFPKQNTSKKGTRAKRQPDTKCKAKRLTVSCR